MEQGTIQQEDSEAQNLGKEGTINGREDLGESIKSNRNGRFNYLRFKMYEKEPFNMHLKVKRPDAPLVEGKNEKNWGQFDIFNVMSKCKISFQSIRQYSRFIWEVTSQKEWKHIKVLDSPVIQK
jgi:hypothetical protein